MAPEYANQKPQGFKNHVEKVAVVGASGRVGKFILEELVKAGKFKVTAISRTDSTVTVPAGVELHKVDYTDQKSLVSVLQGLDALVITMAVTAPPEQQAKLIEAAATASVPWVLPNEFGYDAVHPGLLKDIPVGAQHVKYLEQIEKLGKSSWIGVTCGFWYEFSLSGGPTCYGFDLPNRHVTFFDQGTTSINTSTWPQVGRGVANLLGLKVLPDDADDQSPCLSHYRNKFVYISSFKVSQKDMLDSLIRVTGTKLDDWKIDYESAEERYNAGVDRMKKGDRSGFVQMMYTRVFYKGGGGDFETSMGLQNGVLGLPKEDLDEYTKVALQIAGISIGNDGDRQT